MGKPRRVSWAPSARGAVFVGLGREDDEADCGYLANRIIHMETVRYQEMMNILLTNPGPVTPKIDSQTEF